MTDTLSEFFTEGAPIADTKAPKGPIETRWQRRQFEATLVAADEPLVWVWELCSDRERGRLCTSPAPMREEGADASSARPRCCPIAPHTHGPWWIGRRAKKRRAMSRRSGGPTGHRHPGRLSWTTCIELGPRGKKNPPKRPSRSCWNEPRWRVPSFGHAPPSTMRLPCGHGPCASCVRGSTTRAVSIHGKRTCVRHGRSMPMWCVQRSAFCAMHPYLMPTRAKRWRTPTRWHSCVPCVSRTSACPSQLSSS